MAPPGTVLSPGAISILLLRYAPFYHYINGACNLLPHPLFLNFLIRCFSVHLYTLLCRIRTFAMWFYDGNFTQQNLKP